MPKKTEVCVFLMLVGLVSCGSTAMDESAAGDPNAVMAPRFEVDPLWPKPMPNNWLLGTVIGVDVDANDNVWILHRGSSLEPKEVFATWDPPAAECCSPAPPILQFNPEGDLISHFGGPSDEFDWPATNHGLDIDYKGNIWIGGNGREPTEGTLILPENESALGAGRAHDSMVLKFSQSGQFLMQIGKPYMGTGSNDTENFKLPAETAVDPKTNELYVADGYGNRRIIVMDADTGEYKRHWGAYGNEPDDTQLGPYNPSDPPAQQFRTPVHAVAISNDDLVYVCDRTNNRIQVFQTDGTYVEEVFIAKETLMDGSAFDVALSRDPEQKFLYVADGPNGKVHILDRATLKELTAFGRGGRQPGQFYGLHSITVDSKGNLYSTETYRGQRLQKFTYKGLAPVTEKDQGTVWPTQ